jgi:hypothetical protein
LGLLSVIFAYRFLSLMPMEASAARPDATIADVEQETLISDF